MSLKLLTNHKHGHVYWKTSGVGVYNRKKALFWSSVIKGLYECVCFKCFGQQIKTRYIKSTLFEGFPFCLCVKSVFLFLCYFLFYFDIPSSRALCSVLLLCHKLDSVQLFSPGVSTLTSSPLVYLNSLLLFSALLCPLSWLCPLCVSPKVL